MQTSTSAVCKSQLHVHVVRCANHSTSARCKPSSAWRNCLSARPTGPPYQWSTFTVDTTRHFHWASEITTLKACRGCSLGCTCTSIHSFIHSTQIVVKPTTMATFNTLNTHTCTCHYLIQTLCNKSVHITM